jgi:hypothetical protein
LAEIQIFGDERRHAIDGVNSGRCPTTDISGYTLIGYPFGDEHMALSIVNWLQFGRAKTGVYSAPLGDDVAGVSYILS